VQPFDFVRECLCPLRQLIRCGEQVGNSVLKRQISVRICWDLGPVFGGTGLLRSDFFDQILLGTAPTHRVAGRRAEEQIEQAEIDPTIRFDCGRQDSRFGLCGVGKESRSGHEGCAIGGDEKCVVVSEQEGGQARRTKRDRRSATRAGNNTRDG
jgi:hypothetical protein